MGVTTVLASGLWQDPAVFAIRVVVAVLMVSAGFMIMVMGLLASEGGGPQALWWWALWWCLRGFLLGAAGCLIGSVTALLWYLAVWAGFIVFCGVLMFGIPALVILLLGWFDALAERRRQRGARRANGVMQARR